MMQDMNHAYWICLLTTLSSLSAAEPPKIVGTPPADASRGLVRVTKKEIRHYAGKNGTHFLQSLDNGETWNSVKLPATYPNPTCMGKESPSIAQNPNNGEYIRFEPLFHSENVDDGVYIAKNGLDGQWQLLRDPSGKGLKLSGILRNPLWVNNNARILVPGHGGGAWTWYSDDQGRSWKKSNMVTAPAHKVGGVHKGVRWNHNMCEGSVVELKDKRLWMIARTAQDQHYHSFSKDFGATWENAKPSRFFGTITMPTVKRLKDGRILMLWSNTTALPEVLREKKRDGEDVFTNRDSQHAAISEDEGKTWIGFRELILDEHRNREDYAVTTDSNDRAKHQAEIVELDENRVLVSLGQHPLHRRLMIVDLRWLYEKQRKSNLSKDGAKDWTTHQYINKIVGHCGYNRKAGAQVKKGGLRLLRVNDPTLTNQNQGATWNFPNGSTGTVEMELELHPHSGGLQIALADRDIVPCFVGVECV